MDPGCVDHMPFAGRPPSGQGISTFDKLKGRFGGPFFVLSVLERDASLTVFDQGTRAG